MHLENACVIRSVSRDGNEICIKRITILDAAIRLLYLFVLVKYKTNPYIHLSSV